MKTKDIEKRLEKLGYKVSYQPRAGAKCGFVVNFNGWPKKIFDSANQAAKHYGFIR